MNTRLILLFAALAAFAHAANLTYQSPYTPMDEYAFSPSDDYLINDLYIRGVGGEIGGTESLTVTFSYPVIMQNVQLGLLFSGETAHLSVGADTYALEAFGANQAHYLKNGVLIADLLEDESDTVGGPDAYGMWTLHDPFGASIISQFSLSADAGDFGLMSFNTLDQALVPVAGVPDGAPVLGLLALSMVGLMVAKRRLDA